MFSNTAEAPRVNPGGRQTEEDAGTDKKVSMKTESRESLNSGVMWLCPVTVIYEQRNDCNIPPANQTTGSKRGAE